MGFPSELNQPVITTPQHQMKQIFKNNEITIFSMLNKSNDNTHVTGSFFASNNTDKQLNNVKINFSVKSSVIFKVLSTTGTYLEPRSSLGVKKVNES